MVAELCQRLRAPPGRLVRTLLTHVLDQGLEKLRLGGEVSASCNSDELSSLTSGDQLLDTEDAVDDRYLKAAKGDDVEIEFGLWKEKGESEAKTKAKDTLRVYAHLAWCRRVCRSGCRWLRSHPSRRNKEAVREVVARATAGSKPAIYGTTEAFWKYVDGSALVFWEWGEWLTEARDGTAITFTRPPPTYRVPRRRQDDVPGMEEKLSSKLDTLVDRRYLEEGQVESYIPYFGVNKVGSPGEPDWDIRMVWDAVPHPRGTTFRSTVLGRSTVSLSNTSQNEACSRWRDRAITSWCRSSATGASSSTSRAVSQCPRRQTS